MKILFTVGLPASGKSTWAKDFCKKNKDWIRVNRDDLRHMRGEYWIPKQEDLITDMENACIEAALTRGMNVVLDATNLNDDRNKYKVKKLQEKFPNLEAKYELFPETVKTCIKRDLKRANSVGADIINKMHEDWLKYIGEKLPKPVYQDPKLPKCVIFDVDGTLAKMHNRSPYDWDKVGQDKVKPEIARLADMYHADGVKVIIFTGRDGSCLKQTEEWLQLNLIPYEEIYIRPEGSQEKDSIIKEKLFRDHILGRYNCQLIVDDRDQVVEMWRKTLGLTCLQVDYGNF